MSDTFEQASRQLLDPGGLVGLVVMDADVHHEHAVVAHFVPAADEGLVPARVDDHGLAVEFVVPGVENAVVCHGPRLAPGAHGRHGLPVAGRLRSRRSPSSSGRSRSSGEI